MFGRKKNQAHSPGWLAIDDMFYDAERTRFIKIHAFRWEGVKGGLPLMRVDFIDDRSSTDVINGFGMTVPNEEAQDLITNFPDRHDNGLFYDLVLRTINH